MTVDDISQAIMNSDSFNDMKRLLFPDAMEVSTDSMTRVLEYVMAKSGRKFKSMSKIESRLREGFTEEDLILIVDWKVESWANTDMAQYIRPITLFRSKKKSGEYLEEALNWQAKLIGKKKEADEKSKRIGRAVVPSFSKDN